MIFRRGMNLFGKQTLITYVLVHQYLSGNVENNLERRGDSLMHETCELRARKLVNSCLLIIHSLRAITKCLKRSDRKIRREDSN